jgi:hypothetical protein
MTGATEGDDYTLVYHSSTHTINGQDLTGYTVLTIPGGGGLGEDPADGSSVSINRTDPLSWVLPDSNDLENGTVRCDVWFATDDDYLEAGLYPGDPNFTNYADQVVGDPDPEDVNSVPIPVTLEKDHTYYWRIDTYDDSPSDSEPQPVIGKVFTFNAATPHEVWCEAAKAEGLELLDSDFNEDCVTDVADLAIFAAEWLGNDEQVDLTDDGKVDLNDYAVFSWNWLKEQKLISGDINGDGRVDLVDMSRFSAAWHSELDEASWDMDCDLHVDGRIDILDLRKLAENWLEGTTP